jgi:hypothetical protein
MKLLVLVTLAFMVACASKQNADTARVRAPQQVGEVGIEFASAMPYKPYPIELLKEVRGGKYSKSYKSKSLPDENFKEEYYEKNGVKYILYSRILDVIKDPSDLYFYLHETFTSDHTKQVVEDMNCFSKNLKDNNRYIAAQAAGYSIKNVLLYQEIRVRASDHALVNHDISYKFNFLDGDPGNFFGYLNCKVKKEFWLGKFL